MTKAKITQKTSSQAAFKKQFRTRVVATPQVAWEVTPWDQLDTKLSNEPSFLSVGRARKLENETKIQEARRINWGFRRAARFKIPSRTNLV